MHFGYKRANAQFNYVTSCALFSPMFQILTNDTDVALVLGTAVQRRQNEARVRSFVSHLYGTDSKLPCELRRSFDAEVDVIFKRHVLRQRQKAHVTIGGSVRSLPAHLSEAGFSFNC